jgi:hypothetical protein
MRVTPVRAALSGAAITLATASACGDPFALPVSFENVVDTVSIWAVSGTPLHLPSAYAIVSPVGRTVRSDQFADFDFAFDLGSTGQAVLLPTGAIDLGRSSGILLRSEPFGAITIAPGSGYQDSLAVAVDSGTVAVIRSRPVTCLNQVVLFLYAKLHVLEVDSAERRLKFEILSNTNCGYRGLEPGYPTR